MNTGHIFRASWPILDIERTVSMLKTEASDQINQMAADAGCRMVGAVTWAVVSQRLIAEAPAVPLRTQSKPAQVSQPRSRAGRPRALDEADVRHLAEVQRLADREIAQLRHVCEDTVRKTRNRAVPPIAPGRGNPTLAGYVPEQLGGAA